MQIKMIRHAPDMFADSYAGDVRVIRTAGRRWRLWLRCAGNEWRPQSGASLLRVLLPLALSATAYVYTNN